jgi:hypothetical protein
MLSLVFHLQVYGEWWLKLRVELHHSEARAILVGVSSVAFRENLPAPLGESNSS